MNIKLIPIKELKPHEKIRPAHSRYLEEKIKRDGIFTHPIIIDRATFTILDGHHRVTALKRLGIKKIPALLIDYFDPRVKVSLRHKRLPAEVIKRAVLAAAAGFICPIKTTRHYLTTKIPHTKIAVEDLA